MTTVLNTWNCSFHNLGFVNTHRTFYKTRLSHGLRTDASGKFPEYEKGSGSNTACSNSFLGSPNKIGIIGGASVVSTVNFLRKLAHWSKDGESCPPFVVCSDPALSKELLLIERSSFPSPDPTKISRTELDPTSVVENLRSKRIYLENSGARCIVMPCHISHSWYDEISEGCSVPFLHMGECVAKELKKAKLKPLEAGSHLRIGVLSTHAILTAGFYQEKLQREGFEVVLPDKATMEHTIIPAIEALNRKDIEGAQNLLRIALLVLLVRAVNSIILASDDVRDLLPRDDLLLKKCVDPMDALVWSTIKWATSAEKEFLDFVGEKFKESEKAEAGNLINALTSMQYDGTGSIREHIMKLIDLASKLKNLEITIFDEFLVHLALNSLPSQYSQLKVTYNAQKDKWNLNELISICVQEEERLRKEKGKYVHLVAQDPPKNNFGKSFKSAGTSKAPHHYPKSAASSSKGPQNIKANKTTVFKCFFCNKIGHLKRNCNKYKTWLAKRGVQKPEDTK